MRDRGDDEQEGGGGVDCRGLDDRLKYGAVSQEVVSHTCAVVFVRGGWSGAREDAPHYETFGSRGGGQDMSVVIPGLDILGVTKVTHR